MVGFRFTFQLGAALFVLVSRSRKCCSNSIYSFSFDALKLSNWLRKFSLFLIIFDLKCSSILFSSSSLSSSMVLMARFIFTLLLLQPFVSFRSSADDATAAAAEDDVSLSERYLFSCWLFSACCCWLFASNWFNVNCSSLSPAPSCDSISQLNQFNLFSFSLISLAGFEIFSCVVIIIILFKRFEFLRTASPKTKPKKIKLFPIWEN